MKRKAPFGKGQRWLQTDESQRSTPVVVCGKAAVLMDSWTLGPHIEITNPLEARSISTL